MKFRFASCLCIALICNSLFAAEDVTVAYQYAGNHNTDFGSIRFSLGVGEFSDGRGVENAKQITADYQAESPLAWINNQPAIGMISSLGKGTPALSIAIRNTTPGQPMLP